MFCHSQIETAHAKAYAFSMTLNLNIRAIRKSQGLTLATVAGRVGISIPHLSEIERGEKNLNNHLLERISSALGVAPADLIADDATARADDLARLREVMATLEFLDRERVLAFAEALRSSRPENGQT